MYATRSAHRRTVRRIAAGGLLWLLLASRLLAADPPRLALVIGNAAYQHAPVLRNTLNDVRDIEADLKLAEFDVTRVEDANLDTLIDAVDHFVNELHARGGVGLLYYSGHGIQVGGRNYLLPVDAQIRTTSRVRYEAYALDDALLRMGGRGAGSVNLVVLDACRDNPFAALKGAGSDGLAPVEAPESTLILYAAKPGQTASDNPGGRNGLFTKHFRLALKQTGIDVERAFSQVVRGVYHDSGRKQYPWKEGVLLEPFSFAAAGGATTVEATVVTGTGRQRRAAEESDPAAIEAGLQLKRDERQWVQEALNGLGFELGTADGIWGDRTRAGIRRWQGSVGRTETGYLDGPGYKALLAQWRELPVAQIQAAHEAPASSPQVQDSALTGELVPIRGGCFEMGSPSSEEGRLGDERQHRTCVNGFWIGKYEITQSQWRAVMGSNPSNFKNCDLCPVELVNWNSVRDFVINLNRRTGGNYRIPTEAEWEYACRGGNASGLYCGGNNIGAVAWYNGNSGNKTHTVGQKTANGYGLHDMSGNVNEWTCSRSDGDYRGNEVRCAGENDPGWQVYRGGAWDSEPLELRSAARHAIPGTFRAKNLGFRLAHD